MFSNLGVSEILVIAIVALLIFGPKRLPELLQSFGKGVREFKKAAREVEDEIKDSINAETNNHHSKKS
jgi:sec-independent protein translocase protein TatA